MCMLTKVFYIWYVTRHSTTLMNNAEYGNVLAALNGAAHVCVMARAPLQNVHSYALLNLHSTNHKSQHFKAVRAVFTFLPCVG